MLTQAERKEKQEKVNDLITRAEEVLNTAKSEKRELTDAEAQELAEIKDDVRKIKEFLQLDDDFREMEKMEVKKDAPAEEEEMTKEEMTKEGAKVFSIEMLNNVAKTYTEYDRLTNGKSMVILEPPSIDPRIVNQYAFFSVIPGQVDDIESFLGKYTTQTVKYIINKDLKWQIRDFLDEANISERMVYPGLDGICKWLSRHYYVKQP